MIGGFYKKHHGLNEEGVAPSGSGRSKNFISKHKVLSKRKFSVLLNILLCGKKLKFIRVGNGSLVGLRKGIFSDGAKVLVHIFWGSSWSRTERWIVLGNGHTNNHRSRRGIGSQEQRCIGKLGLRRRGYSLSSLRSHNVSLWVGRLCCANLRSQACHLWNWLK